MLYFFKELKTQERKVNMMEKSQHLNFPGSPAAPTQTHQSEVLSNESTFFFPPFKYTKTLICEHNSFWKHAHNLKHLHIKVNFPKRNNGNSDDSFHSPKIFI